MQQRILSLQISITCNAGDHSIDLKSEDQRHLNQLFSCQMAQLFAALINSCRVRVLLYESVELLGIKAGDWKEVHAKQPLAER
jgi:hypothetical protein